MALRPFTDGGNVRLHALCMNMVLLLFADLQLDVNGCKDVYKSFDKYIEVERFEGENKYHARTIWITGSKPLSPLNLTFIFLSSTSGFDLY